MQDAAASVQQTEMSHECQTADALGTAHWCDTARRRPEARRERNSCLLECPGISDVRCYGQAWDPAVASLTSSFWALCCAWYLHPLEALTHQSRCPTSGRASAADFASVAATAVVVPPSLVQGDPASPCDVALCFAISGGRASPTDAASFVVSTASAAVSGSRATPTNFASVVPPAVALYLHCHEARVPPRDFTTVVSLARTRHCALRIQRAELDQ